MQIMRAFDALDAICKPEVLTHAAVVSKMHSCKAYSATAKALSALHVTSALYQWLCASKWPTSSDYVY